MKTKRDFRELVNTKLFMAFLFIAAVIVSVSSCDKKKSIEAAQSEIKPSAPSVQKYKAAEESEATPFVVVEEMPMFPGGDEALLKYLGENTMYPETAKKNNIQGKVIVRFCVTEKGKVNKISILRGVNPEIDAEAIRVVGTLPEFIPGKQGGKAVPVWYMVPITFTLN
jgi:periplasmic protein TonB